MNISLNWLADYFDSKKSAEEIVEALTFTGVEVDRVERRGVKVEGVIVGQIDAFEPHPNADRLNVCRVNDGSGIPRQIVCGASNFRAGDKAPLALPGAILPNGLKIKVSKLRGVESEGMLCSAKELNLAEDAAGLLILPADTPVGEPLSAVYPDDVVIEAEITPDRADLLSYFGIARELAAIFQTSPPREPLLKSRPEQRVGEETLVRIEAVDACPFYTARIIRGVRVGPSPAWLRRRLEAAGLRAVNNVVDISNYVMLELGQPLHAFDLSHVRGGITVREAAEKETLLALDGKEYPLLPSDLVIADRERALAIGGVMGGEGSGVSDRTTDILLESAYFVPGRIRATSRRLGLISDSSYRFERGVDPEGVVRASLRATDLICELANGTADASLIEAGAVPKLTGEVNLRPERCRAILGADIGPIDELLPRIGLVKVGENRWSIPSFRQDLQREIDLIEEVCRLAGIGRITGTVIASATASSASDLAHDALVALRGKLTGLGLLEARTLTLIDEAATKSLLESVPALIRLRNPLVADQEILRPSLIPGLTRAAARNFRQGVASVRLFEIGKVFRAEDPEESIRLGIVLSGERTSQSWNQPESLYDFFDLKGILSHVFGDGVIITRDEPTTFAALVCRAMSADGKLLGRLGLVRPSLARELGARSEIVTGEFALDPVRRDAVFQFRPLDRYPAVTRDIAFVADERLRWGEVESTLKEANENLLVATELFDLFADPSGESIPAGKKSMACRLTYRTADRTLTQDEVNAVHGRLKQRLVERLGVALRE
jgi:phenylalanyl-tRNA synthetase beta chain